MGGYSAIMMGMKHPEVFSAVYAMSPCCLGMEAAWTEWHSKMPLEIVATYGTNLLQLRGLFIDYGMEDDFSHIPVTARLFSQKLPQLGVPHTLAAYRGDHSDHIRERLETSALPFFSQVLAAEKDETTLTKVP